ncbi:MAG: S8 family peptidase [Chloroflexota bacterium]|nr:S8 family peptidase [Chloroflexota bacterium]
MKGHHRLVGLLLALLVLGGGLQAMPSNADPISAQVAPNEYLVKFVPGTRIGQREAAVQELGGQLVDRIGQLDVDLVRFPQAGQPGSVQAAGDVVGTFEQHPLVEYIQPNYVYAVSEAGPRKAYLPLVITPGAVLPNDPSLNLQYAWGRLDAIKGWSYDTGSQAVVAIVDTGIQLNHPDLQGKILPGYDFVDDDRSADDTFQGHGTHVAGIVGAVTNNGIGVAGTCPKCKLMPVRVLNSSGGGNSGDVVKGIVFATDNGADVINLSLGGREDDQTLAAAVKYAWNKGVFVACAAGNDGDYGNPINYPAYYDACEAVGATNADDSHARYSEYGRWVDIVAPGTGIYSTYKNSSYAAFSGTSMATPFVAGVAGLLAGQGLTNQQIRDRIRQTADQIPGTYPYYSGTTYWSNGRLNLARALRP